MLLITLGGTDVTKYVVPKSLSITQQQNNRASLCSFNMVGYLPSHHQQVLVWEYTNPIDTIKKGETKIFVDKTFPLSKKFFSGQKIQIGEGNRFDIEYFVVDVNYQQNYITISKPLEYTITQNDKILVKKFAGVVVNPKDDDWGKSNLLKATVNCTDYKYDLDRENVAMRFVDMYTREIIGRIIFSFCRPDASLELCDFQQAMGNSGVALPMVQNASQRIQGTYCQTTGISGAGSAEWYKYYDSIDISGYDHIRFWRKVSSGEGHKINAMKLRVSSTDNDYFEYDIKNIGKNFEDCRNYESVEIRNGIKFGNPNLKNVSKISIIIVANSSIASGKIFFDYMQATSGSFQLTNVLRGSRKRKNIKVAYQKPAAVIDNLAKMQGDFWSVDYDRNITYIDADHYEIASISIDETSLDYGERKVDIDVSNFANSIVVIGDEAPEDVLYIQDEIVDGEATSWKLDYKPKGLKVLISTDGINFVEKSAGVEGLVNEQDYNFVYSFQEKVIRKANHSDLAKGTILRRVYYPFKPIAYKYIDRESADKMKALTGGRGIYDGELIKDERISSQQEAYLRAKSEVEARKNPIITLNVSTDIDNIKIGQLLPLIDPNRNINDKFLIQKIVSDYKADGLWYHKITASSTLFGITEFLQALLRKTTDLILNEDLVVVVVNNVDETIKFLDEYKFSKNSAFDIAGAGLTKFEDFVINTGGKMPKSDFFGTGVQWKIDKFLGSFNKSSNYSSGNSLTLSGSGSIKYESRYEIPKGNYNFFAFVKGDAGLQIKLNLYSGIYDNNPIDIKILNFSGGLDFVYKKLNFDTPEGTNYYSIEIFSAQSGNWEVGKIGIENINNVGSYASRFHAGKNSWILIDGSWESKNQWDDNGIFSDGGIDAWILANGSYQGINIWKDLEIWKDG